jgi:FkbM family methyltransferase
LRYKVKKLERSVPNTSWVTVVDPDGYDTSYGMYTSTDKIGRQFDSGKIYEQEMLEYIAGRRYKNLVLDVGANIGNHTLWMAAVCGYTVVAFEPVVPNVVQANVNLNELGILVDVYPWGLGDKPGEFYHVGKGVLKPGKSSNSTDEIVRLTTLDAFKIKRKIDFLKIDVEGHEMNVLRGGYNTIVEHKPEFAIEEWNTETTEQIASLLEPLGYERTNQFGGRGRAPMGIWQVTNG